jgi:transposase
MGTDYSQVHQHTNRAEVELPKPDNNSMVGVGVGVVRFATLSDGTLFSQINSYAKYQ